MNQYGMRGSVLGNSMIASVRDQSAIYYNPGSLAMIDSNLITVSVNLYQYDMVTTNNGAGDGIPLRSREFLAMPNMISGSRKLDKKGKQKLYYTYLKKNNSKFKASARYDGMANVIQDENHPGE
jgi:hypothetical protein